MSNLKTTLPKGSLILVTGATGFVGSQTTKQFLDRGYKVRGTVRDLGEASWLKDDVFKAEADRGDLELVEVPDLSVPNAFDVAVKGVSAIAHIATLATFTADPYKMVPQTAAGVTSLLEAAIREPSVKEFVYTGSIVASTNSLPGLTTHAGPDTWNHETVAKAWAPPPYTPPQERGFYNYIASKVAAEKALWIFAEERKPHFNVNVVSPSGIIGEPLHKKHTGSWVSWVAVLSKADAAMEEPSPGSFIVDVKDVALLHVAAVLDPEVTNARLPAWAHSTNWNKILAILRELRPQQKFRPDWPTNHVLTMTTDDSQSVSLLKKWAGQDGWKSLKDSVAENISAKAFA